MNHVKSLIRLIDKGLSTQVMFKDGSMLVRFRPHDIIGRGAPQAGVVVVRGIVCVDPDAPQDRIVPLCDIVAVFSEQPHQYFATDPQFLQRNPVPRGWTMVHARPPEAATAD